MEPTMRYRLGIDLGTTSIGWCMVRLDRNDKPVAVIRMGTRIFSDGRHPKTGTSLAVDRRLARQMRRRRDRLLKRKGEMLLALTNLGFFPQDEYKRKALVTIDPYELRKKGLYEQLSPEEFGRALFHINQRRGFKSNRKTDKKDSENGLMKRSINELKEKLEKENCQTLGEWLANRHAAGLSVRSRLRGSSQKDKAYDFYADRSMIEHEFDMLWQKQETFNPTQFNATARDRLKDLLLFQRPLKPVDPGRCSLLPDEKRAPLALPSVQRFRIFQEVNNLRVLKEDLTEEGALTLQQRNAITEFLESGKAATFKTKVRNLLGLPAGTQFNLEDGKRDRLKGNTTSATLSKPEYFGKAWPQFRLEQQDEIVTRLLTEASESELVEWLIQHAGVTRNSAEKLCEVSLPEGYGRLSLKAINQILPELEKAVISYAEAVSLAGLESHSALSHAEQTGEIMAELPYYGEALQRHVAFGTNNPEDPIEKRYGKIANPTVHIGLNELRKVVNKLINRYGHPSEIIVEVARELKLSKKLRDELQKRQADNQKRNTDFVKKTCEAIGSNPETIDRSKRRELSQKMQLWYELNPEDPCNRRCPYTGEQISIARLLSPDVEIEHILPFALTLDDSLNNKTVALTRANRDKGNRTPFEAFGESLNKDYDYEAILSRAKLMPSAKARRFAPDGYQRWLKEDSDFIARALNDTTYLSRIAREYLTLVCPPNAVRVIPGRMTAMLRRNFGLNQLLSGSGVKNRDDHRHHALDAAVIAVTDQGLLQRFAKASASAREKRLHRLVEEMPFPWPTFREHVERGLNNIIVSHRPDHGYQGAMHEDTAWGVREGDYVHRREPDKTTGFRKRLTKKRSAVIALSSTNDPHRHGRAEDGTPRPYKGYQGGNNHCIEIYLDEKNRWAGEIVSTFEAYQTVRELGETEGVKKLTDRRVTQSGKPLVMRLMKNDLVQIKLDTTTKIMRVVQLKSNGQIILAEHHEANADARDRDKDSSFSYLSRSAGALQKLAAAKVIISEIGSKRLVKAKT